MVDMLKNFKEKLADGNGVIGPFMKTADPAFVEAAGYAGFDFAILDMEHGPISYESMQNNIRAALLAGMLPIVRVGGNNEGYIGKALDIGALGVQVPQIESAKEAQDAIKAAKFHPVGQRGVCRFVRAAQYSAMDRFEYFKNANQSLVILQLEGQKALENLDSILSVAGIDVIFIGPYDLSQSLGVPGQISHPDVVNKMKIIAAESRKRGIFVGTFVDRIEDIALWKKAGVNYVSYSVDVGIFTEACKEIVEKF